MCHEWRPPLKVRLLQRQDLQVPQPQVLLRRVLVRLPLLPRVLRVAQLREAEEAALEQLGQLRAKDLPDA